VAKVSQCPIAAAAAGHQASVRTLVSVCLASLSFIACGGNVSVGGGPPNGDGGAGGSGTTGSQSSGTGAQSSGTGAQSSGTGAQSTGADSAASASSGGVEECTCDVACTPFVTCTGCTGCPCQSLSDTVLACLCSAGNDCEKAIGCLPDDLVCPL
jgi:hypothetical protein